jgi:hypothetical protein
VTALERLASALAATLWPANGLVDVLAQRPDPFRDDDDDEEGPKRRIVDPDEGENEEEDEDENDDDEDGEDGDEEGWKVRRPMRP